MLLPEDYGMMSAFCGRVPQKKIGSVFRFPERRAEKGVYIFMKKRLPIFSVLVFLYAACSGYNQISNAVQVLSIVLKTGQPLPVNMVQNILMGLLPVALMIGLGVMSIMAANKPELAKTAGILGLIWSGWNLYRTVTWLLGSFSYILGDPTTLVINLGSRIPEVITSVFWLLTSLKLVQGRFEVKKTVALMPVVCVVFFFTLFYALAAIFQSGGSGNVVGVLISGVVKCIPMVAVFCAGILLHGAFAEPDSAPVLTKAHVSTVITYAIVIAIVLGLSFACSSSSSGGGRGDGVNTCRNCGRDVPLVAGFGFCGTCFEGFNDFLSRN